VDQETKQDIKDIKKDVSEINITLERLTTTVEIHEKRSTQLEDRVSKVERYIFMALGAIALITLLSEVLK
jgi:hypothetical protein